MSETTMEITAPPSLWAQLKEDVACVFERDPAARTRLEVLLTYPGVHALIFHRFAHRLWLANWRFTARFLSYVSRFLSNVDIHPGARIGRRFFIDHGAGVVIGETAEVGDDVTLYHGVTLGGTSWRTGKRHPTLENGVVVGGGAKILGPITVRDHAKIGANSVVISDVPAGRTVVGIPGKVVNAGPNVNLNPFGVDLDHHLIPDPVADAISCLMERIRVLEEEVSAKHGIIGLNEPGACPQCELEDCVREEENVDKETAPRVVSLSPLSMQTQTNIKESSHV